MRDERTVGYRAGYLAGMAAAQRLLEHAQSNGMPEAAGDLIEEHLVAYTEDHGTDLDEDDL